MWIMYISEERRKTCLAKDLLNFCWFISLLFLLFLLLLLFYISSAQNEKEMWDISSTLWCLLYKTRLKRKNNSVELSSIRAYIQHTVRLAGWFKGVDGGWSYELPANLILCTCFWPPITSRVRAHGNDNNNNAVYEKIVAVSVVGMILRIILTLLRHFLRLDRTSPHYGERNQ